MKIQIFDVSHGFCAYVESENGNVMLIDCGHNEQTGFRPSDYLPEHGCTGIQKFIIQNYDEDHVSDLPDLRNALRIEVLQRNKSLSPEALENLKKATGPITKAMRSLIDMAREYCDPVTNPPLFSDVEASTFYSNYPDFTDTNNLSVVTHLLCGQTGILFTGDLEKPGWEALLENSSFRTMLCSVNIFIASHHGRESGYCESVFDYCSPDVVIISDKEITHETQKNKYAQHTSGILWDGDPGKRYVLTTRSDGMITITAGIGQGYHVSI